jgi:hypothetical protein
MLRVNYGAGFSLPLPAYAPLRSGRQGEAGPAQIPSGLCGVNSRGYALGGIFTPHLSCGAARRANRSQNQFEFFQIHTAMKKMRLLKPKILLGLSLAIISFQTFLGALFGYFLTKFLAGKEPGKSGKIKSIIFNIKNWRVHLHHWLIAFGIFNVFLFWQPQPFSQFSLGFLGGVIFQGIYCYPDWSKILIKIH